ncbi:MAG: menaquinone biosynthesis family protein [Phycisphaerales bacterium]
MIPITLAHSPDPDDAFMWWPLGVPALNMPPAIDTRGFDFTPIAADIHDLNTRAIERADIDVTAISMFAYAHAAANYVLTSCGSSMGDGYGPKVLATAPRSLEWLRSPDRIVAIPGERTSAYLVMRLMLGADVRVRAMHFREIIPSLLRGEVDAGLVIHEAQVTYQSAGLHLVADLGKWWTESTGTPIPLGANAIRRDLDDRHGPGTMTRLTAVLKRSIEHALSNREQGLDYAMRYAGDTPRPLADRFIGLYVNDLTLDLGPPGDRGERAIALLLRRAAEAGMAPALGELSLVRPAGQ